MKARNLIGVVGGVGPHAGLDLVRKIFDQTVAGSDQEHLSVALLSYPDRIEDRTSFIAGKSSTNPAYAIDAVLRDLESLGASVAGIACNAAHAPPIFGVIVEEMKKRNSNLKLLHIIEEVARCVQESHPAIRRLGLIATLGTVRSKAYQGVFKEKGLQILLPDEEMQLNLIHRAIYDPGYGIKARSNPVTQQARHNLLDAITALQGRGAQAIILGCTEVPLAITEKRIGKTIMLDASLIFARSLIREANPHKLRPLDVP
jgi:aspartate racemase